ncbi:MAG: VCBS repeat-containing protein [Planctomycetes bacterium]|nr:VCBS repeat-containing protein [Planctomycetota bacterium]
MYRSLARVAGCASLAWLAACSDHSSSPASSRILDVVAFETRAELQSGVAALIGARLADLDRDGDLDIVSVGDDGAVSVLLHQSGGAFAPGATAQSTANPAGICAADLDGDGDDDFVVVGRLSGEVRVLRSIGQGDLEPVGPGFQAGPDVFDFGLADVDGDGAVDLLCCRGGAPGLEWFAGVGDGTFRGAVMLAMPYGPRMLGLTCGDFDGDGRRDVAMCDVDANELRITLGDASGLPARPHAVAVGAIPFATAAGDVTGDGVEDLVVGSLGSETIALVSQTTTGAFEVLQTLQIDGQPTSLTLADCDGDGFEDLLCSLVDHRALAVFRGTAQGFVTDGEQIGCTGAPLRPLVGDVDLDGDLDVVAPALGRSALNIYFGQGARLTGGRLHRIDGVARPEVVGAADFDGDGRMDVAVSSFTLREIRFVRPEQQTGGDLGFTEIGSFGFADDVQNVVPADVDRDGRPDLLVALAGGVKVLLNRSGGGAVSFDAVPADPQQYLTQGTGPFEMIAADLDADGAIDVVAAYHANDKLVLVRGVPGAGGTFAAPVETPLSGRPAGLAYGDFDGDGRLELATSRIELSTVTLLELGSNGVLEPTLDVPVGASPNYLRTADFDQDGRTDLVVSGGASNDLTVIRIAQSGGASTSTLPAGRLPTALLTRDLNRDGHADVLVASMAGADFRVLLGDGRGGFAQALVFPGVYSAVTAAFGDLDGDGLEDLLIGSLYSERLATFRNASRSTGG